MSSVERPPFSVEPGDENLTSAMISDSLDAVGLRSQAVDLRLRPVTPGLRTLGRARTLRFEPTDSFDEEDPYREAIDFIDGIRPNDVIVVGCGGADHSALWGELFSAAALGSGAAGVITDGSLRDVQKIRALGFPAFSRSLRPTDYKGRMRVDVAATTVALGEVRVDRGNLVIADDDGVVVIPQAVEAEVLALARARAATESTVLEELLAGESLSDVWSRHRVL